MSAIVQMNKVPLIEWKGQLLIKFIQLSKK